MTYQSSISISSGWRLLLAAFLSLLLLSPYAVAQQQPDPELRELLRRTVNESSSFIDRFDAEVWLVDMSARLQRHIPDTEQRLHILKLIHLEATRAGLLPELVIAVIHVESAFDPFALSSAGAQGLMQVMGNPGTGRALYRAAAG